MTFAKDGAVRRVWIAMSLLSILSFVLSNAAAQKSKKGSQPDTSPNNSATPVFSAETREVPLNVTVSDKSGHFIIDLPQSAFQIFESNVPQTIKIFRREDTPVSMAMVIDNSGSMRQKRLAVEAAALALAKDSNPQDETCVINFNADAFLDVDFTSDLDMLKSGLERIDSRGETAMREAVRLSIDHLHDKGKRDKKVVIVVTDGNDNASEPSFSIEKLVQLAEKDDILIYAIGLLDEEEKSEATKAKRALNLLVQSTGGEVFYPKDLSEVDPIAHQVARDIRNQYFISYSPTNSALDGTYRPIKVVVKAPGNPVARSRLGYWANAPSQPASQPTSPPATAK
jgi:VWFA-related protein